MRRKTRKLVYSSLLAVGIFCSATGILLPFLDYYPIFPQYDITPKHELLGQMKMARSPFAGCSVNNSSEVPIGIDVRGNITFYYFKGRERGWEPTIYIIPESQYRSATEGNRPNDLSIQTVSISVSCCDNSTHFGYMNNFSFPSKETTRYYFTTCMLEPSVDRVVIHMTQYLKVPAAWKQPTGIIGIVLTFVGFVIMRLDRKEKW